MRFRSQHLRGFTLIELLIVIGIIAMLIGFTLPVIGRARDEAKRVKCLSNLRQLGQAVYNYASAYDGSFPISRYDSSNEWDFKNSSAGTVAGILWDGRTNAEVMQCPSYDRFSAPGSDLFTGYNYNTSFLGGGFGETTPLGNPHVLPAKIGSVRHPDHCAMFGDGEYAGGQTNKYMRSPVLLVGTDAGDSTDTQTRVAGTQGYRHRGQTNVCYVDGHAESLSDRFVKPGRMINGAIVPSALFSAADNTGFLSADNSAYDGR